MSCPPSTISGVLISSGSVAATPGPGLPTPIQYTAAQVSFAAVAGDVLWVSTDILIQNTFAVIGDMRIRIVLDGVLQSPEDEMNGITFQAELTMVMDMTSRIVIPATGNHVVATQVVTEGCPILRGGLKWMLFRAPPA